MNGVFLYNFYIISRKAIAQLFCVHSHTLEYKGANIMNDRIKSLVGQPIGVAFKNGLSISGVLCEVTDEEIILMEYVYHSKFRQKHYDIDLIDGIYIFPSYLTDIHLN